MTSLEATVNGQPRQAAVAPATLLVDWLRESLGLTGTHVGCDTAQCGACTVLVDGRVARACVIPAQGVAGRQVTTLAGLGTREAPHPVQQAFIECQAAQCGYCTSGMVMATVALLERCPSPDEAQVREALSHNLCRCGTHVEILQAVRRAAQLMQER